jgi:hypothetical protein
MTFILVVFVESVRSIVFVEIRNRRGNNNGKTISNSRITNDIELIIALDVVVVVQYLP